MGKFVELKWFKELESVIRKNPKLVADEGGKYFVRAIRVLKTSVRRDPWRVGQSGGGVPVDTGNLRDRGHFEKFNRFSAVYGVDVDKVTYAEFVHEGTKRMRARPWLDFALKSKSNEIKKLQDDFLNNVINNLAK